MNVVIITLLLLSVTAPAHARSSGSHSSNRSAGRSATAGGGKSESRLPKHTASLKCTACARDSRGHIQRRARAKHEYQKSNPCPSTGKTAGACPGYVIDHVRALKHGGADAAGNMQWQTKAAANAKDRVE